MLENVGLITLDKVGELFIDKAIEKVTEYKEKKQWEVLFVNTNEFLLKEVEKGDLLIEEIAVLLSSDDMKKLAVKINQESKYELHDRLHSELKAIMINYEIPANQAEFYISNFIVIIMNELEKINPSAFQNAFLGDCKKQERELSKIKDELINLSNAIVKMQENKVEVYSIDQVEVEISKQTSNPSLSLDFFEIDDEIFQEEFESHLDDENIYITGKCKEEIIYCILNELRRIKPEKIVLVIKKEEDWKKLSLTNEYKKELGGMILIPWFYAEQIYTIPNNTNIFVLGEDEYCVGKESLEFRKRKVGTILHKLEKAGLDHETAYKLIDDTHGLYIPLKKKFIRGIDNVVPDWVNGNKKVIIPLLLCGKWTENDGDILVLEDLCEMQYEQIIETIKSYSKGENPLFVRFKVHGTTIYHLASTENAWDYLDDFVIVGDKLWKKYIEIIQAIVSEENPIFSFLIEKQHYAGILPEGKTVWSRILKEVMLRSLIMKAYYKKNKKSQSSVDQVIENIMKDIKSTKQWLSIASLFTTLCEASPKAIVHRLDDEWENETGLKEVFLNSEDTGIFTRNDYTHFIWGLEQFLCQKDYAAWSIRWLFKMHDLRKEYPISNSPEDTLKRIFCPWYNVTVLSQEEKVMLAKEAFDLGYDIWDLFYAELPGQNRSILSTISKPKYRSIEEPVQVSKYDLSVAYREYFKLCISYMDFDVKRWKNILGNTNHFTKEILQEVSEKLLYEVQSMNDLETIDIKEAIRHEIYRNHYFRDSDWSMSEELLDQLEELLNEISTKKVEYEYRYLFGSSYNFPLLHPCPYSENEKREINEKLAVDEIKEGIERFKGSDLNVIELVSICSEKEYTTIGLYLFELYSNSVFDEELFSKIIVEKKNMKIAVDYLQKAYQKDSDTIEIAVGIAKKNNVTFDSLISLLMVEVIDISKTPLICEESEEVKKQYWNSSCRVNFIDNMETCRFVVYEMLKYSNQMSIIEVLDDCKNYFSNEELLGLLEDFTNIDVGSVTQLSSYHLKKIIDVLKDAYLLTEKCERVALLELKYRGLLEIDDMRCFYQCLKISPQLYNDIIAIIFKDDDGKTCKDNNLDEKQISNVFSLYFKVLPC